MTAHCRSHTTSYIVSSCHSATIGLVRWVQSPDRRSAECDFSHSVKGAPLIALGLIGTKIGMTQVFDNGVAEPVTVIELGPCPVLQIKDTKTDGYAAVQLGFKTKPRKNAIRAEQGHVASKLSSKRKEKRQKAGVPIPPKADVEPQRYIREFRVETTTSKVGDVLKVEEVFKDIAAVDVVGTSKGRGFQGVMKRHGFAGLPAAHGAKKVHRQAGSTSSLASNRGSGRPKKGLRRAGQHGDARVTIRNLKVVKIDAANNLILVRGAVPGHNGAVVLVRPTNKL
jgi:large subunit ribosomal protein L3